MEEKVNWITSLVDKYLRAELTEEEKGDLNGWLDESKNNWTWFNEIADKEVLANRFQVYSSIGSESIWRKTVERINSDSTIIMMYPSGRSWKKYGIAAGVLAIISTVVWLFLVHNPKKDLAKNDGSTQPAKSVVVLDKSNVELIIADGSHVYLDKNKDGIIARQGEMIVENKSGEVSYHAESSGLSNEVMYNTIIAHSGGDYKIILPDGSKVWLNTASSLRFPIVFAGNYRNVQLTGEAYFEVSKNEKKPFVVDILKQGHLESSVKVLGTHFDIQAYDDEINISTSLLQGSVEITADNQGINSAKATKKLRPGEQAQVRDGRIKIIKSADLNNVIAWTEGYFVIEGPNSGMLSILRQVSRWYDVDVVPKGLDDSRKFTGKLPRDASLNDVIAILKVNKYTVTREENNKLIVTP
jgi:transmembrane sensor